MVHWGVVLFLVAIYVGYVSLGGFIFSRLEGQEEETQQELSHAKNLEWLRSYPCVSEKDFKLFVRRVVDEIHKGYFVFNETKAKPKWDWAGAAFFAGTVVTTIGYGNQTPVTRWGKTVCVVYALVGIPLTAVMLAFLGGRFAALITRAGQWSLCCRSKPKFFSAVRTIILLSLGVAIFIFLPSVAFYFVEGWDYLDSIYFAFVTLSTVGFGDFVIGQNMETTYRMWYKILCIVWIVLGLAWLSTAISTASDIMKDRIEKTVDLVHEKSEKRKREKKNDVVPEVAVIKVTTTSGDYEMCEGKPLSDLTKTDDTHYDVTANSNEKHAIKETVFENEGTEEKADKDIHINGSKASPCLDPKQEHRGSLNKVAGLKEVESQDNPVNKCEQPIAM